MLKGLLNKAKNAIESGTPKIEPIKAEPKYQQQLDLIVVPQSALDAFPDDPNPLVEAVVDYVNFLFQQAHFNRFEIPAEAIQAYHTDYYLAQVNNGGHAQFVANSQAVLAYTLCDVVDGLQSMNATGHEALARSMSEWAAKNPDEVEKQTGFNGGIAPELAALDAPFYALEKTTPVRRFIANWISQQEVLQAVDDNLMPQVLKGIKSLNPNIRSRQASTRISTLVNQLSNPLVLSLGMAGASAAQVEPIFGIGNGTYRTVDGKSTMTWLVQTSQGKRFGIVDEKGAQIRAYIDKNEKPISRDLSKVTREEFKQHVPIEVGAVVNAVNAQQIEVAKNLCSGLDVPIAVEMLLGTLAEDTTADFVSVRSAGPNPDGKQGVSVVVVANRASIAYSVIVEEEGARLLLEPTHQEVAQVSRAEIQEFIEVLEAD